MAGARLALAALLACIAAAPAVAASQAPARGWKELTVGSELERYLRALEVAGLTPAAGTVAWGTPGPVALGALLPVGDHPWAARLAGGGAAFQWLRPGVRLAYNTGWPYGANDGAIWAGKGLTTSVTAGFVARWRGVSLRVEPVWFRAENAPFALTPNVWGKGLEQLDPTGGPDIDLPQRFGTSAYSRLDGGQSTLQVEGFGLTAGVSTANERWGPSLDSPVILGANAAGIPRVFLGTSRPARTPIGAFNLHVMYGRLVRSGYWLPNDTGPDRFASGVVVSYQPSFAPVEVGVTRFIHRNWPAGGLTWLDFRRPFEGIFKQGTLERKDSPLATADNQLGGPFFRLLVPRAGLEVWGELGYEDNFWNATHLATEPDYFSAYTLGLRRASRSESGALTVWRVELVNGRATHLERARPFEAPMYLHGGVPGGHTQDGQLLGSPEVYGGSSATVEWTRYAAWGAIGARWQRESAQTTAEGGVGRGVTHTLGANATVFGSRMDLDGGVALQWFGAASAPGDRTQLALTFAARFAGGR